MREETEERTKKKRRKKKKSRFWHYLYAVVVMFLTVANITLAALLLTHTQNIQVTGTKNSTKNEITSWIKEDPLTTNSLYTYFKFRTGSYSLPIYLEGVTVKLTAPWSVKVAVREKSIIGCMIMGQSYVYFDADGLVLQKTTSYDETVPLIEGMEIEEAGQYEKLKVNNEKVFDCVVEISKEIEKHELAPDRLVWDEDGMNLYFEQICVKLGKSNFGEKVLQLTPILEKLKGESGILHLEHYTLDSSNISFEKNTEVS